MSKLLDLTQQNSSLQYIIYCEIQDYISTTVNTLRVPNCLSFTVKQEDNWINVSLETVGYSTTWDIVLNTEGFDACGENFVKASDAVKFMKHKILLDICYNVVVTL